MRRLNRVDAGANGNIHDSAGCLPNMVYFVVMVRRGDEIFVNLVNIFRGGLRVPS